MSPEDDLKAILVTYVHESRIKSFKRLYEQQNGKPPSKAEINKLVAMMVANNSVEKEAEELKTELIKQVRSQAKFKSILLNTSIGLPICAFLGVLILLLWRGEIPDELKKSTYTVPAIITAIIFIVVILINLVGGATKKEK